MTLLLMTGTATWIFKNQIKNNQLKDPGLFSFRGKRPNLRTFLYSHKFILQIENLHFL